MTANINIKKLKDSAVIPTYGSEWAAGADLYACLDTPAKILPGNTVFIPTGIALEIPVGYAGFHLFVFAIHNNLCHHTL